MVYADNDGKQKAAGRPDPEVPIKNQQETKAEKRTLEA